MIFGICIDYRSAESIVIRIVLYLKRTFNEDLGICIFNNLMTFHNNVRHIVLLRAITSTLLMVSTRSTSLAAVTSSIGNIFIPHCYMK